jgi:hypothetical protein
VRARLRVSIMAAEKTLFIVVPLREYARLLPTGASRLVIPLLY